MSDSCDPMDCSLPGFPVLYHLPELAQTQVHWIGDAIQPSCRLLSPSPPTFNPSEYQGLLPPVVPIDSVKIGRKFPSAFSCKNGKLAFEISLHISVFHNKCSPTRETIWLNLTNVAMAPHSSTLAWKIPWMEEPGRLQSMGSLGVGHDWVTSLSLFAFMRWRRKWQPTPVFLPGESQGWESLAGCRLWGRTESDTTEAT